MTFPVVLDRSITLHMYSYLEKHPNGSAISDLRNDFVIVFVDKSKAIDKRIDEQLLLGNVNIQNNKIFLSPKGLSTHEFFKKLTLIFNIKPSYQYEIDN